MVYGLHVRWCKALVQLDGGIWGGGSLADLTLINVDYILHGMADLIKKIELCIDIPYNLQE